MIVFFRLFNDFHWEFRFGFVQKIRNLLEAFDVQDTLEVESEHGLPLPPWAEAIFPDKMMDVKTRLYNLNTETPYMLRIRAGPLLTDVYKQMEQKKNDKSSRSITFYSAHDTTVVNILNALDVLDQTKSPPDYCATVAFELHCGYIDDCEVQVI